MDIVPPIATICSYLGITPSTLANPGDDLVTIKAELLRLLLCIAVSRLPFDAEWYCEAHPDIRDAYEAGEIMDLREHFVSTGFFEGRLGAAAVVDEDWYLSEFPDVHSAIAAGRATSARDHYQTVGVMEWRAPRPEVIEDLYRWRTALIK